MLYDKLTILGWSFLYADIFVTGLLSNFTVLFPGHCYYNSQPWGQDRHPTRRPFGEQNRVRQPTNS